MKHVVVRCPGCGKDGGAVLDACAACGNQLRAWCLVHGGEIGWLDDLVCVRCIAAGMRLTPTRAPADAAIPAPADVTDVAPRADVTPEPAAPVGDGDVPGRVLAMLLTLLFTTAAGGLMGIFAGFTYITQGGGGSPLPFVKGGVILGVIYGLAVSTRSASEFPTYAPPTPLPGPGHTPPSAEPAPPRFPRSPDHTPRSAGHATPPSHPSPAGTHPVAAADPQSSAPSKWPGGRSPREILRGPRKSMAELGLPDPPPPPSAGDLVSLAVGGAVFGMVAGWVAATVLGVAGAPFVGATVLGLGGLIVGIIRFAAFQHAARSVDDG